MKPFLIILISILLCSCSSSDDTNTIPKTGTDIALTFKWEQENATYLPQAMVYDELDRPYLFLAAKGSGLLILNDNGDQKPTQVAQVPIGDLYTLHVTNIFQKGNYLYLALGDFFDGINGSKAGLAIINIENPTNPIVESKWQSDEVIGGSAIITVEGNYAYLGAMEFGFYVFDVSNPSEIIEKSNYVPDLDFPVENPQGQQIPNARGMTIVGNTMYLCYDAGGIRIIDVTNKELPDEIRKILATPLTRIFIEEKDEKELPFMAKNVLSGMFLTNDDATKALYQKAFTQVSESNSSEAIQNLVDDMVVKGNQYKSFNFDKVVINLMRKMIDTQRIKETKNRPRNTAIIKEAMAKLL